MTKKEILTWTAVIIATLSVYLLGMAFCARNIFRSKDIEKLTQLELKIDSLENVVGVLQATDTLFIQTLDENGLDIKNLEENLGCIDKRLRVVEDEVRDINLDLDALD